MWGDTVPNVSDHKETALLWIIFNLTFEMWYHLRPCDVPNNCMILAFCSSPSSLPAIPSLATSPTIACAFVCFFRLMSHKRLQWLYFSALLAFRVASGSPLECKFEGVFGAINRAFGIFVLFKFRVRVVMWGFEYADARGTWSVITG